MAVVKTGAAIVELARQHIGEKYVLGTVVPKNDAAWKGAFDCAEFASWLVWQVSGKLYGCENNDGDPAKQNAYTGFWARDAKALGKSVTPDEAAGTPGAFLLRVPPATPGLTGHIVVSDGIGGTVEAMDTVHGVVASSARHRRWDMGVLVPWIDYIHGTPVNLQQDIITVLRVGSTGDKVKTLQRALIAKGYNPGPVDGVYGMKVAAAVGQFQKARGLVIDGEAGPKTMAALGI